MKSYKFYDSQYLGFSDIAALVMVGCDENGAHAEMLNFGEDGDYNAYIVDENAEIGAHYKKVADFSYWLKIYDDTGLVYRVNAEKMTVYRAGEFGCIIQVIGERR